MDSVDFFALLGEPRRPWIDSEPLKERFIALSTPHHPDRVHDAPEAERKAANDRFAALNEAHRHLGNPKDRLAHLLALERGARSEDVQRIPPGTMDLFMAVGQACRDTDAFLRQRDAATSPMVRVTLFERGLDWTERLQGLQAEVGARRDALETELQAMNAVWESAPPIGSRQRAAALPLERLEQIYRIYSYVARWTDQLQERLARLAMP